jgi:hypothetical protein
MLLEPGIIDMISNLKEQLIQSNESFVWSNIKQTSILKALPEEIKSAWIFILKKDIPSGCHYHPNSIQHMVMVEGMGESIVGGKSRKMIKFGSTDMPIDEIWYVIGKGIEHEFFPEGQVMVVISFHTCEAHELEEVMCKNGESRLYEREK